MDGHSQRLNIVEGMAATTAQRSTQQVNMMQQQQ
jgi:hypothetical protein